MSQKDDIDKGFGELMKVAADLPEGAGREVILSALPIKRTTRKVRSDDLTVRRPHWSYEPCLKHSSDRSLP